MNMMMLMTIMENNKNQPSRKDVIARPNKANKPNSIYDVSQDLSPPALNPNRPSGDMRLAGKLEGNAGTMKVLKRSDHFNFGGIIYG